MAKKRNAGANKIMEVIFETKSDTGKFHLILPGITGTWFYGQHRGSGVAFW
jgi:hypothetical protein